MEIRFEETLRAPPARVWLALCVPEIMNAWSEARVALVSPGDSGHPGGVGAHRRVTITSFGVRSQLEEVIEVAEPGRRLVYRVFDGAPVRFHRGELELEPEEGGTRLRWSVDMVFRQRAADLVARRVVVPSLGRSLKALVAMAPTLEDGALPAEREALMAEEAARGAELSQAEAVRDALVEEARRLELEGNPRWIFAQAYAYVTEAQLEACAPGQSRFTHPRWILRLVPHFYNYYSRSRDRFERGDTHSCEAHWRSAFEGMEDSMRRKGDALAAFAYAIGKGMKAHIEEDLPRSLALVYDQHYRERCDYGRLRADYVLMAPIFRAAGAKMLTHFPRSRWPLSARLSEALLPEALRMRLGQRRYPIDARRREAFERGGRLVTSMRASGLTLGGTDV